MLGPCMSSTSYGLVVRGELGASYVSTFEEMTICAHDGITETTGEIIDPSHSMPCSSGLPASDSTLLSLTPLDTNNDDAAACTAELTKSHRP